MSEITITPATTTLVLGGISTNIDVEGTARAAHERRTSVATSRYSSKMR